MHGSLGLCECVSCNQATAPRPPVLLPGGVGWSGVGCLGCSHPVIYPFIHLSVHPVLHALICIAVGNC